jgi:hypothetical protein
MGRMNFQEDGHILIGLKVSGDMLKPGFLSIVEFIKIRSISI